ncbi:MAG: hypothetical protein INR71_02700 [Terriglobus roseus]|nr:hypothetical protein [Terriglobus roseus]
MSDAFHKSSAVLQRLSSVSPQARHYFEILTNLSDAIALRQQKTADEKRRMNSRYMDNVFVNRRHEVAPAIEAQGGDQRPSDDNHGFNGDRSFQHEGILDYDYLAAYDSAAMPYADNVSSGIGWPADDLFFDWQPLAPFFDDTT